MQYRPLGHSGLSVSAICLGTMTWGQQNTEAEAHTQMDLALDRGVTFFDTAEICPVPPPRDTQGRTERYIGSWFKARGSRDKVILTSKVVGPTAFDRFRDGKARLDRANIREAVPLCDYSPLAMGTLSGTSLDGRRPDGARLSLFGDLSPRCQTPSGLVTTERYAALAHDHGLDPARMALAFVNSRPFMASTIIGATNLDQLARDIDSIDVTLSEAVLDGIEAIHAARTYPCP